MKKAYWWVIGIIVLIVLFIMIFRPGGGGEDSWIKDNRGVWIKHGVPYETPDYVLAQQQLIDSAVGLYNEKKQEGIEFNSQCLGTISSEMETDIGTNEMVKYVVDIVHVPRSDEDNLVENQCEAYRSGEVSHFIELDKYGEVVRIN